MLIIFFLRPDPVSLVLFCCVLLKLMLNPRLTFRRCENFCKKMYSLGISQPSIVFRMFKSLSRILQIVCPLSAGQKMQSTVNIIIPQLSEAIKGKLCLNIHKNSPIASDQFDPVFGSTAAGQFGQERNTQLCEAAFPLLLHNQTQFSVKTQMYHPIIGPVPHQPLRKYAN